MAAGVKLGTLRRSVLVGLSLLLVAPSVYAFSSTLPLRLGTGARLTQCPSTSPRLGSGSSGVVMMASKDKNKKDKKDGKPGKSGGKMAPGAVAPEDDDEERVVMKKVDTDVKGATTKEILALVKEKMAKTVENTRDALGAVRTGRPSPNLLDKVMVDYYGAPTPLPQVAAVQVQSASMITVDPFDKSALKDVERAIVSSDLGLNPSNDGSLIRINIPPLNAETRLKYAKQAKALGEEGKVALRNIRRTGVDAVKKLEKDSGLGEDESKSGQDQVQQTTDKSAKEIDKLAEEKEKDLMKV